jgi:hypothetical protein
MGMGYGANYVDVMEDNDIKKLCPNTWDSLVRIVEADEDIESLENFAQQLGWDEHDDCDDVMVAYTDLQKAFNRATGLDLSLGFHDHDDCGDRYDDINGHYWHIDGVYDYTPAGKKFGDKIERKMFVTFG